MQIIKDFDSLPNNIKKAINTFPDGEISPLGIVKKTNKGSIEILYSYRGLDQLVKFESTVADKEVDVPVVQVSKESKESKKKEKKKKENIDASTTSSNELSVNEHNQPSNSPESFEGELGEV